MGHSNLVLTITFMVATSLANISCSGYVLGKRSNPFFVYRIDSVTVPAFRNETPFAELGAYVGQEVVQMLADFPDLKVSTGRDKSTDAVLFGVIRSTSSKYIALQNTQFLSSNTINPVNTSGRDPFLIPSANSASLMVDFSLVRPDGKILWTKSLPYNARYTVELYDGEGASVIHSQTLENSRRSFKNSARDLAQNLKNLVIDAF